MFHSRSLVVGWRRGRCVVMGRDRRLPIGGGWRTYSPTLGLWCTSQPRRAHDGDICCIANTCFHVGCSTGRARNHMVGLTPGWVGATSNTAPILSDQQHPVGRGGQLPVSAHPQRLPLAIKNGAKDLRLASHVLERLGWYRGPVSQPGISDLLRNSVVLGRSTPGWSLGRPSFGRRGRIAAPPERRPFSVWWKADAWDSRPATTGRS